MCMFLTYFSNIHVLCQAEHENQNNFHLYLRSFHKLALILWLVFVKHYFVTINSNPANRKRGYYFLSNLTCTSRLCSKHARRPSRGSSRVSPAKHNAGTSRVDPRGHARTLNSTMIDIKNNQLSSNGGKTIRVRSWATHWPLIGCAWAADQSHPRCREAVAPSNSREGFESPRDANQGGIFNPSPKLPGIFSFFFFLQKPF